LKHPLFISYGYAEQKMSMSPNSMTGENKGKLFVKFNDDSLFLLHGPKIHIAGLMFGKRYVNCQDFMLVEDLVRNYKCI
jgi:hypothetical protein